MAKIGSQKTCKAFNNDYTRCNKPFIVNHVKQKFCSDKCRKRHNRKIKERIVKKNAREEKRLQKERDFINSRIGKGRKMYNELINISMQMDYYNTPVEIPKERSITSFDDMAHFHSYAKRRTDLEREEKQRKEKKKYKLKELENAAESIIKDLVTVKSFIPATSPKEIKEFEAMLSNLDKMDNFNSIVKTSNRIFQFKMPDKSILDAMRNP